MVLLGQLELCLRGGGEHAGVRAQRRHAYTSPDPLPRARTPQLVHTEHEPRSSACSIDPIDRLDELIGRERGHRVHAEADCKIGWPDIDAGHTLNSGYRLYALQT